MSKYIVLCEKPKKLEKIITNTEKYTLSDSLSDDSCDVIFVQKNATVTESDLDMIANMLDSRKVVVATSQKKSGLKKILYRIFGASHGENCCGVIGIPHEHIPIVKVTVDAKAISIIKNAETKKLPIVELPLSKSELSGGFSTLLSDLYYLFLRSQPLKFVFSSCVAFMIDCTVFTLVDTLLLPPGFIIPKIVRLLILQLTAWSISSPVNFLINRFFVFKSKEPFWPSVAEYYGLAVIVFLLKTLILEVVANVFPVVSIIAKITAEVTFFIVNYLVQKFFIFKPNHKKDSDDDEASDSADSSEE